jgi:hypothetical protein
MPTHRSLVAAVAFVLALAVFVPAQTPAGSTRSRTWELGAKLSFAAIGSFEGAPKPAVDKVFQSAAALGQGLDVDVPALPDLPLNKEQAKSQLVDYILNKAGAPIAEKLGKTYGADHAALFEVAVKSNLLLLLYAPGESVGGSVAAVLKKRAPDARLPEQLWQNVVAKLDAHATYDDVKAAVVKMQGDVRAFLKAE